MEDMYRCLPEAMEAIIHPSWETFFMQWRDGCEVHLEQIDRERHCALLLFAYADSAAGHAELLCGVSERLSDCAENYDGGNSHFLSEGSDTMDDYLHFTYLKGLRLAQADSLRQLERMTAKLRQQQRAAPRAVQLLQMPQIARSRRRRKRLTQTATQ